jgi:hypothetical protein
MSPTVNREVAKLAYGHGNRWERIEEAVASNRTQDSSVSSQQRHTGRNKMAQPRLRSRSSDREELPGTVYSLQGVHSPVLHRDVGAQDEVAYSSRSENLIGSGRSDYPGRDVHADAAEVSVLELDLAGVQARSNLQADASELSP